MKTLLYLPPFLATRRFDHDTRGLEALFRNMLDISGVRRKLLSVEARFPANLRLNNEFHHTGSLSNSDLKVIVCSSINSIYATSLTESILDDIHALPSALDTKFDLVKRYRLPEVDGILLSSQSSSLDRNLADRYVKKGIPVFYFDNLDREYFYEDLESCQKILNKWSSKYTLCFIKDIPVEIALPSNVIPIAPVPVSHKLLDIISDQITTANRKNLETEANFGFFGRRRRGISRDERQAMLDIAIELGGKHGIYESSGFATLREIYQKMASAKFVLSPSGRVWCSFRHTELAALGRPILMNKPNCHTFEEFSYPEELQIPSLKSGQRSDDNNYRDVVRNKMSYLQANAKSVSGYSADWLKQVRKFHTREARAQSYGAVMLKLM